MADDTSDVPAPASGEDRRNGSNHPLDLLLRADVLSGLLFVCVGALGLYLSRNYDLGTAARMGTAYMPRLCCFALIGLGSLVLIAGLLQRGEGRIGDGEPISWRSLILVPAAVFAFGFTIERIGLVLAILTSVAISSIAVSGQKPMAVALAALFLVVLCVGIFVIGLGLPFSIWLPDN